jgi:hypothetical protein
MKTSPRPVDISQDRARRQDAQAQPDFAESRPGADRVAQRAYERYVARGRADGHDREDWFEAERELDGGVSSDSTAGGEEVVNSDDAA